MYTEENYLLLSGIQHFQFCRRQWALIHIEQQWEENVRTIEGELMHKNAHDNFSSEKRSDLIISRGMSVFSKTLGVSGACDIVEFHRDDENGVEIYGREGRYNVFPVEYKRGTPKTDDIDILQLAAQAMCLEEMLLCQIDRSYLFYGETRRRLEININDEIKEKVKAITKEMHQYFVKRHTPKVKTSKKCNSCSLKELCLPKLCKNKSAGYYIKKMMEEDKHI